MKNNLTEEDIQCLAKIIAMIPGLPMPADSLARLQTYELIEAVPAGWMATEKGVNTIVNWGKN